MMTIGAFCEKDLLEIGTCWQLQVGVNGYAGPVAEGLVTQAAIGRSFQVIEFSSRSRREKFPARLKVRLLEDGYCCWLELADVVGKAICRAPWEPILLDAKQIQQRIPAVLSWISKASANPNKYLWGGTFGPDFDCSGLIQTAFASEQIWLPRDAYQQERFCDCLEVSPDNYESLIPGDLIFFGDSERCTHVAVHKGDGFYWHSSGRVHGRNGIGCDGLNIVDKDPIGCHYRSQLRGAGRVVECHDGTTLP